MAELATLAPWRMSIRGLMIGGNGNTFRLKDVPDGLGVPDISTSFTAFAQADGGFLQGDRHDARTVRGRILVMPPVRGGGPLWQAVETLKAAFSRSSTDIPVELRVGDGRPVRMWGRPTRCEIVEMEPNYGMAVAAFEFVCGNPLFFGDQVRVSLLPASGTAYTGRVYPRVYPLTYGGVIPNASSGRVTVVNDGNYRVSWTAEFVGPVTGPELTHLASGRAVRWSGDVPAGSRLRIDSHSRAVLLDDAPAYWLLDGIPDWWLLEPGVNEIGYSATTGSGPCEFAFTPAWL